jgi:hypothetical protein
MSQANLSGAHSDDGYGQTRNRLPNQDLVEHPIQRVRQANGEDVTGISVTAELSVHDHDHHHP